MAKNHRTCPNWWIWQSGNIKFVYNFLYHSPHLPHWLPDHLCREGPIMGAILSTGDQTWEVKVCSWPEISLTFTRKLVKNTYFMVRQKWPHSFHFERGVKWKMHLSCPFIYDYQVIATRKLSAGKSKIAHSLCFNCVSVKGQLFLWIFSPHHGT